MAKLDEQIFNVLQNSSGHMSADDVYMTCKSQGISASVASVYRVLGALADKGRIHRISLPGQSDLFDKTLTVHEHLICSKCGKVSDFVIADLAEIIKQETGIMPDSFELFARYVCDDCRTDKAKTL